MKVLIACEFSGVVRRAFRERGHDAWSCDILPSEDGSRFHIQGDALALLKEQWDMVIAHPPCTYLTNAGVRHLHDNVASRNGVRAKVYGEERWLAMEDGAYFFNAFRDAPIRRIAIENPIPHKYAKEIIGMYSQLIQPWMFGHGEIKATCLWLKGLPKLQPTHRRDDLFCEPEPMGRVARIHRMSPGPNRSKERSRTYPGIGKAMAEQWGRL